MVEEVDGDNVAEAVTDQDDVTGCGHEAQDPCENRTAHGLFFIYILTWSRTPAPLLMAADWTAVTPGPGTRANPKVRGRLVQGLAGNEHSSQVVGSAQFGAGVWTIELTFE